MVKVSLRDICLVVGVGPKAVETVITVKVKQFLQLTASLQHFDSFSMPSVVLNNLIFFVLDKFSNALYCSDKAQFTQKVK